MLRRSPLRQKRDAPRRTAPERVQHERKAPKAGAAPNVAEKAHMSRVAALGCLVCGARATLHHVSSDGYKRIARSHQRIVPLCNVHHQVIWGPKESVEALGHAGFTIVHGIDLLAEADRLWRETNGEA